MTSCWYCMDNELKPVSVTLQKIYRISIYPTSNQVLALALPDRWQIVDRDWLIENEDSFGNDVCHHVVDQVLTIDRQNI